jgi:molybdopterin converting factor small subunit
MLKINVYFFSTIRAIIGIKRMVVEIPAESTVWDLKMEIARLYPISEEAIKTMLTSVNKIFSNDEEVLEDQAEIAFFPFVSGG